MFAALVSLVGAAGTVLLVLKHLKACKSTGDTPSRTLFVRCGLILLIQLFFTVWSAIGLVDCADPMAVVVAIVAHALLCGCAYFNIHRDCVLERLQALEHAIAVDIEIGAAAQECVRNNRYDNRHGVCTVHEADGGPDGEEQLDQQDEAAADKERAARGVSRAFASLEVLEHE